MENLVFEADQAGIGLRYRCPDDDLVVVMRGLGEPASHLSDRKQHAFIRFQIAINHTRRAAILHTPDLHPNDVIRVIGDAHLVRLRIPDPKPRFHWGHEAPLWSQDNPERARHREIYLGVVPRIPFVTIWYVPVKVLFFGQLKDVVGRSEDALDLQPGATLQEVFDHYARQFPRMEGLASSIVMARNQQFSSRAEPVQDGDEIAFLPPVSGGTGPYTHVIEQDDHFFALTRQPIDASALKTRLVRGEDGAVVDFEGVVRNNTKGRATKYLDYECYEAMAIQVMAQLGTEIAATHAIGRIAMVHRLGRMGVGEASVVIVVTAPHRKPAFEAALEGINRLKKTVPIWKKEYFVDGEVWVEGEWDDALASR